MPAKLGREAAPRKEAEVFASLSELCAQPGYIHALAYLIYRDSIITAGEEFTKEDFLKIYSPKRLIRTEFAVLMGLLLKGGIDETLVDPFSLQAMIDTTDQLMLELHQSILLPAHKNFSDAIRDFQDGKVTNPLARGAALREAMFYGGESAFTWQYLHFSEQRYEHDSDWLLSNRGFTINQAVRLTKIITEHLADELLPRVKSLKNKPVTEWTMLPCFCFRKETIVSLSGYPDSTVDAFLEAFTFPSSSRNEAFTDPFTQNLARIYPFFRLGDGTYTSFQEYITCESLYDNPFYWMYRDSSYRGSASQNRGRFAETICSEFLQRVFKGGQVHRNVLFKSAKGATGTEADALVVFGSTAFVFQAKSKRLTETAKAGDEFAISRDFKAAVQDAYDQACNCIEAIRNKVRTFDETGPTDIPGLDRVQQFYPICIVSDHYPALSFQVEQFLKPRDAAYIANPLVFDVFTLDIITEFLRSPLYFVDYICKRSSYSGKISSSHEMVVLSYHLRRNLYLPSDWHFLALDDDFLVELDLAVNVRRRGLPGPDTPDGILTRDSSTPLGQILQQIDASDRPEVHEIGYLLLNLSGQAFERVDGFVSRLMKAVQQDGRGHDISIPLEEANAGLTIHCNSNPIHEASKSLIGHCELRKYAQKADQWFGICLSPDGHVRFATGSKSPWRLVPELEQEAGNLKVRSASHWVGLNGRSKSPGRNSPCPCESGRKFKHCHGRE